MRNIFIEVFYTKRNKETRKREKIQDSSVTGVFESSHNILSV